ncbi:MAG: T9SS type A sorting domain-containing protein [Sphingobacteriales bacterium]|nr:T9SS type A sorting domain-containing protein [Sphingobacteriales bacterium]
MVLLFMFSSVGARGQETVTASTFYGDKPIKISPISRGELFFSEFEYITSTNVFATGFEVTAASDNSGDLDLTNYRVEFYCACPNSNPTEIHPIHEISLTGSLAPNTAKMENDYVIIAKIFNNCRKKANDPNELDYSQPFYIALIKTENNEDIIVDMVSLIFPSGAYLNCQIGLNTDFEPSNTIAMSAQNFGLFHVILTDYGWHHEPNVDNFSMGVLNEDLTTTSNVFILKYLPTNKTKPIYTYHNSLDNFSKYNGDNSFLASHNFTANQLQSRKHYYFKHTDLSADWNTSTIADESKIIDGNKQFYNYTNPSDYNRYAILTTHFSACKTFDYLIEAFDFNTDYLCDADRNFYTCLYKDDKDWGSSGGNLNKVHINGLGATKQIVGHEIGHGINRYHGLDGVSFYDEGFADIWGTLVEWYIDADAAPDYTSKKMSIPINSQPPFSESEFRPFYEGKNDDFFNSDEWLADNKEDEHLGGTIIGKWFYFLAEGVNDVKSNILFNKGNIKKNFIRQVCGINPSVAQYIVYHTLKSLKDKTGGFLKGGDPIFQCSPDPYLMEDCMDAIRQNSLSDITDITNVPFIQDNINFVKAQVKNAWAAVGVGQADFSLSSITTYNVCKGQPIKLYASTSTNETITWKKDGTTLTGGNIVNMDANGDPILDQDGDAITQYWAYGENTNADPTLHNGTYTATISYSYTQDGVLQTCTFEKEVEVVVHELIVKDEIEPLNDNELIFCEGNYVNIFLELHPGITSVNSGFFADNSAATYDNVLKRFYFDNIQPEQSGTFTVTATCDDNGTPVTVTATINIVVLEKLTLTLVSDENDICSGENVYLTATTDGSVTWYTQFGNDPIGYDFNFTSPALTQTTTFRAEAFNSMGCPNTEVVKYITITVNPNPTVNLGNNLNICTNELPHTLDAGNVGSSFLWSNNQTTQTIEVTAADTYTVTVTDANGCTATDAITITTQQLPAVGITATAGGECATNTTTLSAVTDEGGTFLWNDAAQTQTPELTLTTDNIGQTFTVTFTSSNTDCQNTATYTVVATDFLPITTMQTLSTNTIWNNETKYINGVITVPAGITLTINNSSDILFLSATSGIIVQAGGRLVIDNSTLRGTCATTPQVWQGITVEGTWDQPQATPTDIATYHGSVELTNNTVIENAKIGVDLSHIEVINNASVIKGGGILTANDSYFNNCSAGVVFSSYRNHSNSEINNCEFNFLADFSGTYYNNDTKYIGIHVIQCNDVVITNNKFIRNLSYVPTNLSEHGFGIRVNECKVMIGELGAPNQSGQGNTFTNLYMGIDVYGAPSIDDIVQILANSFNNTRRGITLNGNGFGLVINNTFNNIPKVNNNTHPEAYGVWAQNGTAYLVTGNILNTNEDVYAGTNYTYGIVSVNTADNGGQIYDNHYTGVFDAANLFVGNNSHINIDCNAYNPDKTDVTIYNPVCLSDWRIIDDPNNTQALNDQGHCDINPNLSTPLHEKWHLYTSGDTEYHIENLSATNSSNSPLKVQWATNDPAFEPFMVTTNVDISIDCSDPNAQYCQNLYPENPVTIEEQFEAEIAATGTYSAATQNALARVYTMQGASQTAINNLTNYLNDRALRILTATYYRRNQADSALWALNQLPQTTAQNTAFYSLYTALIADMEGTGKKAAAQITDLAQQPEGQQVTTLAQSKLALQQGKVYHRHLPTYKKQQALLSTNNTVKLLQIAPNPADNTIELTLDKSIIALELFDITGKRHAVIAVTGTTLQYPTAKLHAGVYIWQYTNNTGNTGIVKMVVNH